jgi:hypothetical protein
MEPTEVRQYWQTDASGEKWRDLVLPLENEDGVFQRARWPNAESRGEPISPGLLDGKISPFRMS